MCPKILEMVSQCSKADGTSTVEERNKVCALPRILLIHLMDDKGVAEFFACRSGVYTPEVAELGDWSGVLSPVWDG
jgi:hypothetical protein